MSADARSRTAAFYAPTKTFSLAGLIGSYHIIYDDRLRSRVRRQGDLSGYNSCNVLSMHALTGAYSHAGMEWVDQLCAVLDKNLRYIRDFMESRFPGVSMMLPQGTYMLFLDCEKWLTAHGKTMDERRSLRRRRLHPHQRRPAPCPGAGGHGPAGKIRLCVSGPRQVTRFWESPREQSCCVKEGLTFAPAVRIV